MSRKNHDSHGKLPRAYSAAMVMAGLLAVLGTGGCASPSATSEPATHAAVDVRVLDTLHRYQRVYLLQAGDKLEVFIYRQPDFSRTVIIRPDGFITLPLVGDVRAAGKSPTELAQDLTRRFSARLLKPEVNVIVQNPPEPMVYVVGEVGGPKAVSMRQAKTVAQAIAEAGVVPPTANLSSVSIVRLARDGRLEALSLNVDAHGSSDADEYMALQGVPLEPNDLVVVPESFRGKLVRLFRDVNAVMNPYFQYRILRHIVN